MVDEDKTDVLLLQLIASFQGAAMMQLGKLGNPVTGKLDRDLDQARHTIDMLIMLQEKTRGNLTDTERELLDKYVFELQMNYMDELKADEGGGKAGGAEPGAAGAAGAGADNRAEASSDLSEGASPDDASDPGPSES